jgi:DNA-binding winged helix-turn-helix (wHTH) protein
MRGSYFFLGCSQLLCLDALLVVSHDEMLNRNEINRGVWMERKGENGQLSPIGARTRCLIYVRHRRSIEET